MVEQRPVKSQLHEPCSSLCLDFLQAFMQVSELFASVWWSFALQIRVSIYCIYLEDQTEGNLLVVKSQHAEIVQGLSKEVL